MTHSDLVNIGYKWCLKRCGFAFKELVTNNIEQPDIIGFKGNYTFLLEAKSSRSDFLNDKKKVFREYPEMGMGDFRFFIIPKGLITINELPNNWGLIEVNEKGKTRLTHNPFGKGNIYSNWKNIPKDIYAENRMMYSALRRLQIRNRVEEIYKPLNE
ncbi:hypothetical protein T190115A13A_160004 [Tenacibaculum sp. 190524A02b]|uniref:Uncharacterized protein n=1 Tax=Tenacibaculum vairaonense TaxID=3137860 RepID=A0ABP1F9J6_9FLAO